MEQVLDSAALLLEGLLANHSCLPSAFSLARLLEGVYQVMILPL